MDLISLEHAAHTLWLALGAFAGVGIVAMASVQLLKDQLPIRRTFQRRQFWKIWYDQWQLASKAQKEWASRSPRSDGVASQALGEKQGVDDLINLACGGNELALFVLPIEQLAGQLAAASQVVLESPSKYPTLLWVLARGADANDVALTFSPPAVLQGDNAQSKEAADFIDARNRIAHQIQRNLDALQSYIGYRWKLHLQQLAIIFGGVFIILCLHAGVAGERPRLREELIFIVVGGLISGFFATVVYDILKAVGSLRGGSQ